MIAQDIFIEVLDRIEFDRIIQLLTKDKRFNSINPMYNGGFKIFADSKMWGAYGLKSMQTPFKFIKSTDIR